MSMDRLIISLPKKLKREYLRSLKKTDREISEDIRRYICKSLGLPLDKAVLVKGRGKR